MICPCLVHFITKKQDLTERTVCYEMLCTVLSCPQNLREVFLPICVCLSWMQAIMVACPIFHVNPHYQWWHCSVFSKKRCLACQCCKMSYLALLDPHYFFFPLVSNTMRSTLEWQGWQLVQAARHLETTHFPRTSQRSPAEVLPGHREGPKP